MELRASKEVKLMDIKSKWMGTEREIDFFCKSM